MEYIHKYNIYLNGELFSQIESKLSDHYSVLSSFFRMNDVEADYFDTDDGEIYASTWQGIYTIEDNL